MQVVCPPDSKNVLVDLMELWDGCAGGGRVQEPGTLVIHVQHLYAGLRIKKETEKEKQRESSYIVTFTEHKTSYPFFH